MKLKRRKISLYESPKRNKKCTREKRNKVKEVNSTDITSQNARHTVTQSPTSLLIKQRSRTAKSDRPRMSATLFIGRINCDALSVKRLAFADMYLLAEELFAADTGHG